LARLPVGVRGGCSDDHPAQNLPEAEYLGGTPAAFLSDTGKREKNAAPAGEPDLFHGAATLLGTFDCVLSRDGVGCLRDPAADFNGTVYDEIPVDERKKECELC